MCIHPPHRPHPLGTQKHNSPTQPRRLLTFALDGGAVLPPSDPPSLKVNVADNPDEVLDPKAIALGKSMFIACMACHGKAAISTGGPAPDLRESPVPLNAEAFYSVLHDGLLMEKGMPRFTFFDKNAIEGIRQYIRAQSRKAVAGQK